MDLKNTINIAPTLEDRFSKAVKTRNRLAHHYFYKRSRKILSWQGREHMISELQEQADVLQALDTEFTEIMKNWMERLGTSREDAHEEMRTFLRENDSTQN